MGNSLSSWGGRKKVQSIISSAGLPLQIDDEQTEEDSKAPLSPFTEAYSVKGWFTGVRSQVTILKPPETVYASLSKRLDKIFTPITECEDEMEEDDGKGREVLFRVVRIPFKVAFVTGNLKLRLHVEQDSKEGKIHFNSVKAGRLITEFIADFSISRKEGEPDKTEVALDAKINAQSLPPPPFKGMVKDIMVRKMDSCMVDLVQYHSRPLEQRIDADARARSMPLSRKASGFFATLRKSLGRRPSLEKRRASLTRTASENSEEYQESQERIRNEDWQTGFEQSPHEQDTTTVTFAETDCNGVRSANKEKTVPTVGQAAVFDEWQRRNGALHA